MTSDRNGSRPPVFPMLERLTAALLLAVLLVLGWIVSMAYFPAWARLASTEHEVILVVALVTAALALVSIVALVHTRS